VPVLWSNECGGLPRSKSTIYGFPSSRSPVRVVQFVHSKSRKSQISKSPSSRGPVRVVQFVHSNSRELRVCIGIPKHESVGKPSGIQAIVRRIVIETVL